MGVSSTHKPFAAEKVQRLDQSQVHGTIGWTHFYGCHNTSNGHDVSRIIAPVSCSEGEESDVKSSSALARRNVGCLRSAPQLLHSNLTS
jgi:hypothetical protein